MDILSNFTEFDDERLAQYLAEVRAALDELFANEDPSDAQLDEGEALADHIDAIVAEQDGRVAKAEARAERAAALRNRFADNETPTEDAEGNPDDTIDSAEDEVEAPEEQAVEEPAAVAASAKPKVAALAKKVARPAVTANLRAPVVITASADVPEFATGSHLPDMKTVGQAAINRMKGFAPPTGDGTSEDLRYYGVASFHLDFPDDLTIDRGKDEYEVLVHAGNEHRLPGKSLTAAGGWCAPSETIYDLCTGATTEGILSIPETNWARGGIKFPTTPDFSTVYSSVGFCVTEAQAIAGTPDKTCFEVPCPTFTEVRLDACGLCIKIPLLTQAGYPEVIDFWTSQSMIAHQHKMNNKTILAMVAAAGTAKTVTGAGSTAADTTDHLTLVAAGIRSKYRLSQSATLEVVVPWFVKDAIASDLRQRTGQQGPVSDEQVNAEFSARHLNVQFVYDWQDASFPAGTAPAIAWPATYTALMYPAGTFVRGSNDIINLSAVYDAASLVKNTYTGLFMEQGWGMAKLCYEAQQVTLPICNGGKTGAATLACP